MQSERPLVISDTQVSGAGTSGGAPTFSLPALTQTFKCISVPCERATRCVPGQLLRLPLLRRLIRTAAWPGGGGGGAGSSSRNKALPLWAPRPSGPWEKPTLRGSGKHRKAGPELEGAPALLLPTGWQSVSTPGGLARPAWVSPRGRQQHPHLGACYQCRSSRPHPDLRLRKRRRRGLTPSGLTSPPGAPGAQAEGGRKGSGWRETPPLPGCELTQEKRTCTLRPQEGKQGYLLGRESQRGNEPRGDPAPSKPEGQEEQAHHHCLAPGLRATHGEPFPGAGRLPAPASHSGREWTQTWDRSCSSEVQPGTAVTMGFEISPPVTFQLQAGSGPVVLSGQEYHWRPEGAPRRWQVNTSAPVLGRLRSLLGRGGGGGCVPGGGEPLRTSQEAGAPEADQRRQEKGGRRGGSKVTLYPLTQPQPLAEVCRARKSGVRLACVHVCGPCAPARPFWKLLNCSYLLTSFHTWQFLPKNMGEITCTKKLTTANSSGEKGSILSVYQYNS
ncbi:nucleoplasmin-2 isoform X2 [Manis javanica]|uniref:nucleoplasmin-2 isoform X2 n=1 Tax=Manis javanica TaxID=9974 RepID=UPI003C6D8C37